MRTAVIVCLLVCGFALKPSESICYNPSDDQGNSYGYGSSWMMEPNAEKAKGMIDMEWDSMSMEEAATTMYQTVNETFLALFQEAYEQDENMLIAPVAAATMQGMMDSKMGWDVMKMSMEKPYMFAESIGAIIGNFNPDCMDKPNELFFDTLNSMLSTIYPMASKEEVAGIIVQFAVVYADLYDSSWLWKDILNPLTESLKTVQDITSSSGSGAWTPTLAPPKSLSDLIEMFVGDLIDQKMNKPEGILLVVAKIITNVQAYYGMTDDEIIAYASDVFTKMLTELN